MERKHRNRSAEAYARLRRTSPTTRPAFLGLGLCDAAIVLTPEALQQRNQDLADMAAARIIAASRSAELID